MPEEAKKELLSANKASSSLPKIIKTGYNALDLIYFFTSGEDEVKCWTIRVRSYITACYWVPILNIVPSLSYREAQKPHRLLVCLEFAFVRHLFTSQKCRDHSHRFLPWVCLRRRHIHYLPSTQYNVSQTANRATATVMKYVDFKELGSDSAVKAAGKYTQQGKNYTVEDGDIIFFRVNAGAGLNKK